MEERESNEWLGKLQKRLRFDKPWKQGNNTAFDLERGEEGIGLERNRDTSQMIKLSNKAMLLKNLK